MRWGEGSCWRAGWGKAQGEASSSTEKPPEVFDGSDGDGQRG